MKPLHERPEYIAMRDALAEQLFAVANGEQPIPRTLAAMHALADRIAPVLYVAVETQCVQWQRSAVEAADTIVMAITRLEQMDRVVKTAQTWHKANKLLGISVEKLPRSDRELAAEVEIYNTTRAKDN